MYKFKVCQHLFTKLFRKLKRHCYAQSRKTAAFYTGLIENVKARFVLPVILRQRCCSHVCIMYESYV